VLPAFAGTYEALLLDLDNGAAAVVEDLESLVALPAGATAIHVTTTEEAAP